MFPKLYYCILEKYSAKKIDFFHLGSLIKVPGALSLHTRTSSGLLEIWLMMTDTPSYLRLIACTDTYSPCDAFLFYAYRSVSFTRMQRYTQLAYLFHLCGTSLFSRDGRLQTVLWDIRVWSASFLVYEFV